MRAGKTPSLRLAARLAALGGFVAVAAGAFGAHGVQDMQARAWLQTGALYLFVHSLASLACVALQPRAPRISGSIPLFLAGGLVFGGSLFAMALGAPRFLGAVTPVGGVLFLAGWLWLALALGDLDRASSS